MLKRVSSLPPSKNGRCRRSPVEADVRAFCRNSVYDVAEVMIEGRRTQSVVQMLRRYIALHPEKCEGVAACQRDGRAYLYRKGVTDE